MIGKLTILLVAILFTNEPTVPSTEPTPMVSFLKEYLEIKYPNKSFDQFIYIAAKRQSLYLVQGDSIRSKFTISTAKNGLGNDRGSFQTPEGLHSIAEKVGKDEPINTIISRKMSTGQIATINNTNSSDNQDLITSRVLHLKGMEPGMNAGEGHDSYSRGIFIHGTHEEGLLGKPASKGCVRMANQDIIALFKNVEVGTFVIILNN